MSSFEQDFLRGRRDCKDGVPHKSQGDAYDRGYAAQYQHEQNMGALSHG